MNPRFKVLAEECGFLFWQDEAHGPGPGNIDWSVDYSREFERYSHELARWVISRCESNQLAQQSGFLKRDWVTHTLSEFDLGPKI
jgi:hypothetical protein